MTRSMLVLAIASVLFAGCSQPGNQQPAGAASQPAGAPPPPASSAATPATPPAAPAGQARSESAPPPAAAPAGTPPAAAPATTPAAAPATPPPAPPPPPEPKFREVSIPAETIMLITLTTPLASNTSKVEDQVKGTVTKPIVVSGTTVVP
ncbi:MAG: hypothetical protein ACM4AI_12175, partial [Acidobacteriota bacterium]